MAKQTLPPLERMVPKIDFTDDCWLWTAGRDANGYGRFFIDGETTYAHIAVWTTVVGPVLPGLVLDHVACDNPSCVNPDHLEPKSRWANVARSRTAATAVNARKTECINGHPFDEGNTRHLKNGERACRTCGREAMRRWRAAQNRG